MRKSFTMAVIIGGTVLLPLTKVFGQYSYGDKFQKDPYATVTKDDQKYVDIKGNEFTVRLKTAAFPDGKDVIVDPDDMMPINNKKGRVVLIPRKRLLEMLNSQLPPVGGMETPKPKPGEGLGVGGVTTMFKHLTDEPEDAGHGADKKQIMSIFVDCHEKRNIPNPTKG